MKNHIKSILFTAMSLAIGFLTPMSSLGQEINLEESYVQYTGYKNVGSMHTGKLLFSQGELSMDDGAIAGGNFTIEIESLTNEDLKGGGRDKFLKHMKSGDFLEAETYPTAHFEISTLSQTEAGIEHSHEVTGQMTIKDVTKEVSFPANIVIDDNGILFTGFLEIDRTEFNMKWGSKNFVKNLAANRVIKDSFDLSFHIQSN